MILRHPPASPPRKAANYAGFPPQFRALARRVPDYDVRMKPAHLTSSSGASRAHSSKPLRVLLVEDNPDDAHLICHRLEREGFTSDVRVVSALPDLDVALADQDWDLVLSDMALPGFNGYDVLMHAKHGQPLLPVIALSGLRRDPRGPQMLAAGATAFVSKDDLAELPAAVSRAAARLS